MMKIENAYKRREASDPFSGSSELIIQMLAHMRWGFMLGSAYVTVEVRQSFGLKNLLQIF